MLARFALLSGLALLPVAGHALDLSIPGSASLTREITQDSDSYRLPLGPFEDGTLRTLRVEGPSVQQAWRIEGQGMTTAQIFLPLRDQIEAQGFDILFDCAGSACGGFDFRFNTRVMAAPDIYVDLLDYRFLSARKDAQDEAAAEYVSVLVSRSGRTAYVQIMQAGQRASAASGGTVTARPAPAPVATGELEQALLRDGHVILSDLVFETGASDLADTEHASLQALAAFLRADPNRRIALVGHTDSVGGLDNNIALSRRRAASVLERLVSAHDVPRTQLESNGIGYLSPIMANTTPEGREANRRVEAVLLDTE